MHKRTRQLFNLSLGGGGWRRAVGKRQWPLVSCSAPCPPILNGTLSHRMPSPHRCPPGVLDPGLCGGCSLCRVYLFLHHYATLRSHPRSHKYLLRVCKPPCTRLSARYFGSWPACWSSRPAWCRRRGRWWASQGAWEWSAIEGSLVCCCPVTGGLLMVHGRLRGGECRALAGR